MNETPASEPVAFFGGRLVPASQVRISPWDQGFIWGATVSERLRTFGGRLFRWKQHLERFRKSLEVVGISLGWSDQELQRLAEEVVAANYRLLPTGDDLDVTLWATPGNADGVPNFCILTAPLRWDRWCELYESGVTLETSEITQVPATCWPTHIKCRSRMHYFLADRHASAGSQALLLDTQGWVSETPTANVLAVTARGVVISPPLASVLPGISLACTRELCVRLDLPFLEQAIKPQDLLHAAEVLLTSTPYCILPVTRLDGQTIGPGTPGPIYRRLLAAWKELAGLDVVAQARSFAG
jgi:branched-subunit amino acid aminotransferase/4-amino-4-deoxychorismate lyase